MSNSPAHNLHTPLSTEDNLAAKSNLTTSQFAIWVGQTLYPDIPLYNMVHTFTIDGSIDVPKFQAAFQALVDCSDALRTVIDLQAFCSS